MKSVVMKPVYRHMHFAHAQTNIRAYTVYLAYAKFDFKVFTKGSNFSDLVFCVEQCPPKMRSILNGKNLLLKEHFFLYFKTCPL